MFTLPLYIIAGLINIVAKKNNYLINVKNDANFDVRVKRAVEASETTTGNKETQDNILNDRERRGINTDNRYNLNQLNMPYGNQNTHGNQNNNGNQNSVHNDNPNYYYNGGNMYNPFNNNINARPYKGNTGARDTRGYVTPSYGGVYNTQKTNYNDVQNNYPTDYGQYNSKISNVSVNNSINNQNASGDNYRYDLNTNQTTTPMNIALGQLFSFGCPKGYRRVSWRCMKIQ